MARIHRATGATTFEAAHPMGEWENPRECLLIRAIREIRGFHFRI